MSPGSTEVTPMTTSAWEDIVLAAKPAAALEERGEALLRLLRPGRLIRAGRSLAEGANLKGALQQAGSESFCWIVGRTLRGCTCGEQQALIASLTGMLTLFAACQAQRAGGIESMRRLTLEAARWLNG